MSKILPIGARAFKNEINSRAQPEPLGGRVGIRDAATQGYNFCIYFYSKSDFHLAQKIIQDFNQIIFLENTWLLQIKRYFLLTK